MKILTRGLLPLVLVLTVFIVMTDSAHSDDYICGDANSDGRVNVSDAVYIINYVFTGGFAPVPMEAGDANLDGRVNVSDAVAIVNYVFSGKSICVSGEYSVTLMTGCKTSAKADPPLNMDCVVIDYDGSQTLAIRHYNTVFNCCPLDPYAEVLFDGSIINVNEYDNGQCYCMCVFDIFYEITDITPGEYTIVVSECWPQNSDHTYTIDLSTTPYDSICIERTDYPYPPK